MRKMKKKLPTREPASHPAYRRWLHASGNLLFHSSSSFPGILHPRYRPHSSSDPAAYALTLAAIFHPASTTASPVPVFDCGVYSTLNSAKLSVTFSVNRSSPPLPPVEIDETRTSFIVILR